MWGEGSRAEISVEGVCAACSAKPEHTAPSAGRGLLGTLQLSGVDGRMGEFAALPHHLIKNFAGASAQSVEEPAGIHRIGC